MPYNYGPERENPPFFKAGFHVHFQNLDFEDFENSILHPMAPLVLAAAITIAIIVKNYVYIYIYPNNPLLSSPWTMCRWMPEGPASPCTALRSSCAKTRDRGQVCSIVDGPGFGGLHFEHTSIACT